MYEKPQYPTPDGYRRSANNPYKKSCLKKEIQDMLAIKAARLKKINDLQAEQPPESKSSQMLLSKKSLRKKIQISDKAAQLIAITIKNLLKS